MSLLEAHDEAQAVEQLHELGCTDGLPVIVPTTERVARMALASGYDPDLVLGSMGPAIGACTVEKLAACAVMAGCKPDYMPIVVAAARAVIDERFDLTEMQATTHAIAPLVIVHGPAREWCGVHGGYGALGPGYRANASIGRALRLAMINIGGGRAGSSDMALLGHPGKFTMCLAEDQENSPFEPLHVSRGLAAAQSAVTVIGTDAPQSVIASVDADDPGSPDRVVGSLAAAFAHVTNNNVALRHGQAALALNPDHAQFLARSGYDRAKLAEAICERATVTTGDMAATAGWLRAPEGDRTIRCFDDPDDLLIFVAGGGGLYSAAFASWCAGPHVNRAVTVEIEVGQACEIPGFAD